jgi:hypothetical protein
MRTDRAGDRFFTDIRMTSSVNQPPLMTASQFFFRQSNDLHLPVKAKASLRDIVIRHQECNSSLIFKLWANRTKLGKPPAAKKLSLLESLCRTLPMSSHPGRSFYANPV